MALTEALQAKNDVALSKSAPIPDYSRVRHVIIALVRQRLRRPCGKVASEAYRRGIQEDKLLIWIESQREHSWKSTPSRLMQGFPILGKAMTGERVEIS